MEEIVAAFAVMAFLVVIFFGGAVFVLTIRDTFLVWFAPKVWLIEQLAQLAKAAR